MTRILVKDLEPGRLHYIQARINAGTEVSPWSSLHDFTTISDTLAPAPCTGLAWTVEGTAFKAVWTGPITNADGTPLMDFKDFQVKVYSPAAPSTVATYYTTAARFDFPFEANVNSFGTPRAQVTIEVRARDNSGNISGVISSTATNPAPSNVTGLTAVGITDAVALRWASVTDTDLKQYEVRQGTSLGAENTLVYTGRGTSFVFDSTASVPQYFAVVAVDVFGTPSATPAKASATPKSSLSVDGTPPSAPTNVQVVGNLHSTDPTGSTAFIDVSWTQVADTDLQNYLIRYASSPTTTSFQYVEVPEGVAEGRIHNLLAGAVYYVSVAAVDYSGNMSTWTQAATYPITLPKDTTAPAAPAGLVVGAGVTTITATWNSNTEADVINGLGYYQVQLDTANTFNTGNLQDKQVGGTVVSFSNLGSNTPYFVRIRAVDSTGNAGAWSSIVSATPRYVANSDIQAGTITGDRIIVASLSGDRITANTLDAASIKANTTFSQNVLVGAKFTMAAAGIMESSNYVAGVSGWQLKNNTLEIVDGTIQAKALRLQNGQNLLHPAYTDFEWAPTWYTGKVYLGGGAPTTWSIATAPEVTSRFGTQALKISRTNTNATYSDIFLSSSSSDYNLQLESGLTYIASCYVYNPTGTGAKTFRLKMRLGDGSYVTFIAGTAIPDTGTWVRVSGTYTVPAGITSGVLYMGQVTTGDIYVDGVQLEVQTTAETAPSQWKPPSFTTIDGGIIRTGEIRSTASANGLAGQPAWSINTQGNAQFGDANVRGRLVVGDPNNPAADGVNSRIYSSNYVPGATGWIIRSDGYAEFRNLAVNSVKVTAFDSPFQNTAYAKLFDYMQDGSLWLTNGSVSQRTDPGAFSANSLFEFTGPGLIIRNGTGVQPIAFDPTILYRVSARVRAYSVTPLNTNSDFEAGNTTGWVVDATNGATIAASTTEKYAGTYSMKMTSGASTGASYRAWTNIPVKENYNYTINARVKAMIQSAYYNATNQGNIEVRATWFGTGGYMSDTTQLVNPPVDSNGAMLTVPTPWFSVGTTFTAPPGATNANFIIRLARYDNVTSGTVIGYLDDIQITTPPRIKLGVFGTDMDSNIIDYDYVSDVTTPTKKHAFPAAGSYGTLSTYTPGQYMAVADNDEIATAVASSGTTADWVTLTGYIRGRGGSGTDGSFGNPSKAPDPYQPASLNAKVSYLIPYVEFDVASGTKAQVDQFSLEAFEGGAPGKVATGTNSTEKSVTIEKKDGETFDHALRFFTGNADERRPALIGHSIDNDMNDAAHLRIMAPRLVSDADDLSSAFIGIWERNPNYIYDASFENGITGWTGMANTAVSWNQTDGYSDSNSLIITATGTISSPSTTELLGQYSVSTLVNQELIGQTVTVSGRAKMGTATGRNVRLVVKYMDESGVMIPGNGWYIEKAITNADWTSYSFYTPTVIPDNCYSIAFSFSWFNGATGDIVYVDDVQLEAGGFTAYRSAQASAIALNAQVVRSSGNIIISTNDDVDLPSQLLFPGDRLDAPSNPGIILQTEGGTGSFRNLNFTDSYGPRTSTALTWFANDGTEEGSLRIYSTNDARFPGQVTIGSGIGPSGGGGGSWALATQPSDPNDLTARFDTHVYGRLFVDGELNWKPIAYNTTAMTAASGRAPYYAINAGKVFFRGTMTINSITPGTGGTILWTLPAECWPDDAMYMNAIGWTSTAAQAIAIHTKTNGEVVVWAPNSAGLTSSTFSLEGLSYAKTRLATTTPPSSDTTAPSTPSSFKISALSSGSSTGSYRLTWTNPSTSDTAGVKIIWRSDRYPTVTIGSGTKTLTTDGKIITVTGTPSQSRSYDHSSLPVNKTIYYRVVSYDKSGNHSTYVSASRYLLASPVTVYADSSDSYRLGYGGMWRNDGDDVYQGDWTGNDNHRGLFFYGTKIYDAVSKGGVVRTPTKMTIYMKRTGSGGNNAGVGINLNGHKFQVKPSGDPIGSMVNEGSDGNDIVYLSPNEGATITIPSSWYNNFVVADPNNTDRLEGLAVYGSSNSDYAIMYGRGNSSSNGKVTIYHKG